MSSPVKAELMSCVGPVHREGQMKNLPSLTGFPLISMKRCLSWHFHVFILSKYKNVIVVQAG